jgi:prepilin-type N-terminal cleavage/methylation domain-containing protein
MKKNNFRTRFDDRYGDRGFTLIEVLVAMIVAPIIVGGLVVMLLMVFNVQNGVSNRISGAVDAQVTTTNLDADVANASSVMTTSAASTPPSCNTSSTGTQILATETQGDSVVVSYVIVPTSKTKNSLVRYSCASGNTATPPQRDRPIERRVGEPDRDC